MFAVHHQTDLWKLIADLRFVGAPDLLEADHHQILKEVLTAGVAVLPGCVVWHHRIQRLCRLGVSGFYTTRDEICWTSACRVTTTVIQTERFTGLINQSLICDGSYHSNSISSTLAHYRPVTLHFNIINLYFSILQLMIMPPLMLTAGWRILTVEHM